VRDQRWIFDGANPVADAFRTDFERLPHAGWARHFSRVAGQAQATITRAAVKIGEKVGWPPRFVTSQADGNYSFAYALGGKIEDGLGWLRAELADGVKDPADGDPGPRDFTH